MLLMENLTSKEFDEYRDKNTVMIIPVGALEEHGDHLPLSTDTLQSVHIVSDTAKFLEGQVKVLIGPTLSLGLIRSTRNFPGSISLSFDTVRILAYEVMRGMANNGLRNIVVISGHAGRSHMMALRLAAHKLIETKGYNHLKIMVLSDYDIAYNELGKDFPATDGHAGELETSRIMAIRPELVKGKGIPTHPEFPPYRIIADAEKYFPTGVMGDPRPATAEKGYKINEKIVKEFSALILKMIQEDDTENATEEGTGKMNNNH